MADKNIHSGVTPEGVPVRGIQIFKECDDCKVTTDEEALVAHLSKGDYAVNRDSANGYVAFALLYEGVTREDADSLVDALNELSENNGNGCPWFLGDENEEYVFVD